MESFTVMTVLPTNPEEVFKAWLSSEGHSQMTGSRAKFGKEAAERSQPGMAIFGEKHSR